MGKKYLLLYFLLFSVSVFSQNTSLKGTVISTSTKQPVSGISVQLRKADRTILSEYDGSFYFEQLNAGPDTLIISSPETNTSKTVVNIEEGQPNDIGSVAVLHNDIRALFNENSLLDEESIGDEAEQGDYNVASLMTSSNDVYISNTTYNFSAVRFRVRGYENRYSDMFINGINFNDPERGGFSYGMIGGLNDATRSKDIVNGFNPSSFMYGQVGASGNINTHATNYSHGGRASVAYTNRSYKLRGAATYSTGLMNNGWAITGSLAYRWADEGFIEGTFYNSLGYMLSIEKEFNSRHRLSFTTLGAPTQRAQQSANFQETCDLVGSNFYNSYWGWQNGKKRNSRIVNAYEPMAVLSHIFNINKDTKLTTGIGFRYTMYSSTALNWFNSADPRPDYYRYLPSYQTTSEMKDYYTELWGSGAANVTQVNWDRMYRVNELQKQAGDGNALYMLEERHNDQMLFSLNSTLNTKLNEYISLTAGLEGNTTKGMHYKTMNDLLGADYFVDVDQFAGRDFQYNQDKIQNDMNNPNRKVTEGDRFGYDYDIHVNSANIWVQNAHRYNKWDIYYGVKGGTTSFWREGNMKNGRAPENSYGKGKTHSFINYSAKAGLTYKLSGRHIFSGNISYSTLPPLTYNAYLSARVKDNVIPELESEKVFSANLSYNLSTPVFRGSLSVFQTNFYDQAELSSFYYDIDNTFVNYALTGVDKTHRGVELGVEAKVNSFISLSLAGTIAEYVYTNRPTGTVSYENGSQPDFTETVYLKNFYVSGTPQTAGTFGVHLFYKYWFVDVNVNGFDRTYVDLAPNRRTESTVDFVSDSYEEKANAIEQITNQEKFDGGFTLDFSIGKSLRIDYNHTLNINVQFNNILNNTKLKTGGFEQSRFDYTTHNVDKFPNRYYYSQGFNFFLNVGLRF